MVAIPLLRGQLPTSFADLSRATLHQEGTPRLGPWAPTSGSFSGPSPGDASTPPVPNFLCPQLWLDFKLFYYLFVIGRVLRASYMKPDCKLLNSSGLHRFLRSKTSNSQTWQGTTPLPHIPSLGLILMCQ